MNTHAGTVPLKQEKTHTCISSGGGTVSGVWSVSTLGTHTKTSTLHLDGVPSVTGLNCRLLRSPLLSNNEGKKTGKPAAGCIYAHAFVAAAFAGTL